MPEKIEVNKKYVSRKIKSLKWKPPQDNNAKSNIFVSGSWDDEENNLSVWQLDPTDEEPFLLQEILETGNINSIQYITRDLMAIGKGNGTVAIYEHGESYHLHSKLIFNNLHKLKAGPVSCTALASNGEQLASVGEDGRLIILNPKIKEPIKIIESDGGCSDYAVVFVKASEVLTTNMQGHLKLWDLRAQNNLKMTLLSPDQVSIYHLAIHPTQQHLVAAAGEDGTLSLWDMRSISQPLAIISAHNSSITEVQFHPSESDHLFTCSFDGQILHWDASSSSRKSSVLTSISIKDCHDNKNGSTNAWLTPDVARGSIDTVSLVAPSYLPFNTIHIESNTLIAGSDNEAIYVIKNIL